MACLSDTVDGFPSSSSSSSSLFLRDCQPQRKLGPYTILCRSQYPRRTSDNKNFQKRYPWEETEHSLSLSRRPPSWQSMNMRRRRTMPMMISTGIGGIKDIWRIRKICQNLNLPKISVFSSSIFSLPGSFERCIWRTSRLYISPSPGRSWPRWAPPTPCRKVHLATTTKCK